MKLLAFVATHQVEFTIHPLSNSRVVDSIVREANVFCHICEDMGCSVCDAKVIIRDEVPPMASGKEIEEFYDTQSENMWVDPAEMELDGDTPTLDK